MFHYEGFVFVATYYLTPLGVVPFLIYPQQLLSCWVSKLLSYLAALSLLSGH